MNILIPIASFDNEIENTEYIKSLYEIEHKIAFQYIYESLYIKNANFIVIIRREDIIKYHFDEVIKVIIPNVKLIIAEGKTNGSLCSCLLSIDYIDNDQNLLIANTEQLITHKWQEIIDYYHKNDFDGGIVIFNDVHPKWSFVKLDSNNMVIETAEKRPISRAATAGYYFFKKGKDFVESAKNMIKKKAAVNGQYYCCPVYNEMILENKKIGVFKIERNEIHSFKDIKGMNDYSYYLRNKV